MKEDGVMAENTNHSGISCIVFILIYQKILTIQQPLKLKFKPSHLLNVLSLITLLHLRMFNVFFDNFKYLDI